MRTDYTHTVLGDEGMWYSNTFYQCHDDTIKSHKMSGNTVFGHNPNRAACLVHTHVLYYNGNPSTNKADNTGITASTI